MNKLQIKLKNEKLDKSEVFVLPTHYKEVIQKMKVESLNDVLMIDFIDFELEKEWSFNQGKLVLLNKLARTCIEKGYGVREINMMVKHYKIKDFNTMIENIENEKFLFSYVETEKKFVELLKITELKNNEWYFDEVNHIGIIENNNED